REALHVTLCFLGHVAAEAVGEIGAIALSFTPRPVSLELQPDPVPIPPRRPRLLVASAVSEAAVGLQAELSERLAEAGHYKLEERAFWPHVTLARMRPERRGHRRPAQLEQPLTPLPNAVLERFHAVRATLYRSRLRPAGAVYEPLAGLELPGAQAA
ncbi:MAG: RNA 2',3'-cyclic phosphodiesterase, partial [Solirubrobacterales bacterium]|nr:RNA 2',3'-cyclic phosphodiesterase [Solirubrobacterales bacterium]